MDLELESEHAGNIDSTVGDIDSDPNFGDIDPTACDNSDDNIVDQFAASDNNRRIVLSSTKTDKQFFQWNLITTNKFIN